MSNVFSRRTPYDDEYGTCAETRVERTTPSGRKRTVRNSLWELSSAAHVQSLDIRRHLDWLLARLKPQARGLAEIQNIAGVRMTVNCPWYSRVGHGGPTLWPEQMLQLAELNLECSFDIYFLPDDET